MTVFKQVCIARSCSVAHVSLHKAPRSLRGKRESKTAELLIIFVEFKTQKVNGITDYPGKFGVSLTCKGKGDEYVEQTQTLPQATVSTTEQPQTAQVYLSERVIAACPCPDAGTRAESDAYVDSGEHQASALQAL